jgi:hypothetical protein
MTASRASLSLDLFFYDRIEIFKKFVRPEAPGGGPITGRDLDIVEAILRHRFSLFAIRPPRGRQRGGDAAQATAPVGDGSYQPLGVPQHPRQSGPRARLEDSAFQGSGLTNRSGSNSQMNNF